VALILFTVIFLVRKQIRNKTTGQNAAAADVSFSVNPSGETNLKLPVTVNDIDITGKNREEAKKAVLEKYSWKMTAVLDALPGAASSSEEEKDIYTISDLLTVKLDKILSAIYDGNSVPKDSYTVDSADMDSEIAAEVSAMAKKWNTSAKNGSISGFDKDSGAFTYSDSSDGIKIDQDTLTSDIKAAMDARNYKKEIAVESTVEKAELSKDDAKKKYKVIGTYTTKATDNADRNNNLELACAAIDGKILQKGEEFSFNNSTGNRTVEKGYKAAGAYQNGIVVQEPGGGVCQVSSTLYNAVIESGLQTTERHAHTFAPTYVTPGEDATVSYDGFAGPDMKFINTTESAIAIRAAFHDKSVTVSIVGIPVLEDGVTVTMHSVQTNEYDNASTEYVEDPTMVPGEEKLLDEGTMGSRWVTNLVTKKKGTVVSDVLYHTSTYKGHSKKVARNTSGVQETGAAELTITENTDMVPQQPDGTDALSTDHSGSGYGSAAASTVDSGPGVVKASTTAASPAKTNEAEKTAAASSDTAETSSEAETVETVPSLH